MLKLIGYFNTLASLPLDQAIRNFSRHGVDLFTRFADDLGHILSNPFRLMVRAAVSSGSRITAGFRHTFGNLRDYLFRHAESIFISPMRKAMVHVPGALQPIVTWFNRQHFTQTGLRWLKELTTALRGSQAWQNLWRLVTQLASAAGTAAGHAFTAAFIAELKGIPDAILSVVTGGPGAPGKSPHPNPQQPPGQHPGFVPSIAYAGANHARGMGSVVIHAPIHIHGADLRDAPTRRRIADRLGKEIAANWRRRADGH